MSGILPLEHDADGTLSVQTQRPGKIKSSDVIDVAAAIREYISGHVETEGDKDADSNLILALYFVAMTQGDRPLMTLRSLTGREQS